MYISDVFLGYSQSSMVPSVDSDGSAEGTCSDVSEDAERSVIQRCV